MIGIGGINVLRVNDIFTWGALVGNAFIASTRQGRQFRAARGQYIAINTQYYEVVCYDGKCILGSC